MQPVGDGVGSEDWCKKEWIQLVDAPDHCPVYVRNRRTEPVDAQRQTLVEQLVCHDEPVGHLCCNEAENRPGNQPKRDRRA